MTALTVRQTGAEKSLEEVLEEKARGMSDADIQALTCALVKWKDSANAAPASQ